MRAERLVVLRPRERQHLFPKNVCFFFFFFSVFVFKLLKSKGKLRGET